LNFHSPIFLSIDWACPSEKQNSPAILICSRQELASHRDLCKSVRAWIVSAW
jgi:hypothetical protein